MSISHRIWCTILYMILGMTMTACHEETSDATNEDPPPRTIGGDRPAKVHYPADYDGQTPYPVAVMLHGYSVNGLAQDLVLGATKRVTSHQFILIVPEGTKDSQKRAFWNAFPDCCDFEGRGVDDVSYLIELLEELEEHVHIDRDRVAFFGHSNGGYMTYRMACERPDWVRRIVVIAGSMPLDETLCDDPAPTRVLHIHGSEDDVVPFENNVDGPPGEGHGIVSKGAEDSVARWVETNQCDPDAFEVEPLDLMDHLDGQETQSTHWTDCITGQEVTYWRIDGADHLLLNDSAKFRDGIADFLVAP